MQSTSGMLYFKALLQEIMKVHNEVHNSCLGMRLNIRYRLYGCDRHGIFVTVSSPVTPFQPSGRSWWIALVPRAIASLMHPGHSQGSLQHGYRINHEFKYLMIIFGNFSSLGYDDVIICDAIKYSEVITLSIATQYHCSDVTWTSWHLRLPATLVFVQQFVRDNIKETSKVGIPGPLWRGCTDDQ